MLLKALTVSQCKIDKSEFSSQMPTFKVEPFGPKSVTAHAQKITTTALSVSNQSLRRSVAFCMMCNPEGFPVNSLCTGPSVVVIFLKHVARF